MKAEARRPAGPRDADCGVRRKKDILRHDDACQTTLNPGFKWECLEAVGLPAARRTCTPGFRCIPVVVIKGQGVCLCTPSDTAEDVHKYTAAETSVTPPVG